MNIIANDCVGGELYKLYNEQYTSPFIWSILPIKEFIKLYKDYDRINFNNVEYNETPNYYFPWYMSSLCIDNYVNVYFLHHHKIKGEKEITRYGVFGDQRGIKYEKIDEYLLNCYKNRVSRKDSSPVFIFSQEDRNSEEELKELLSIRSCYKLIFITSEIKKYSQYCNEHIILVEKPINNIKQTEQAKFLKENFDHLFKKEDSNTKLFIFSYKYPKYGIPEDDLHTPFQVGADFSGEDFAKFKDNIGDNNIGAKNPYLFELTGLYWLWKNYKEDGNIGVEAYRRRFELSKNEIDEILKENDIIVPVPLKLLVTLREQYETWHSKTDINMLEYIIKEFYPEYAKDWDDVINKGEFLYYGNGFITNKENFDGICEFCFGVLDKFYTFFNLKEEKDFENHAIQNAVHSCPQDHLDAGMNWVDYQKVFSSFLFERLLTLYVKHNFKNIKEIWYNEIERKK